MVGSVLRAAASILVVATAVGVLMPSRPVSRAGASSSGSVTTLASERSSEPSSSVSADGRVMLERDWDGHFYADAKVNGATIHFLVDTGATGVALAQADAQRASVPYSIGSFEVIGQGASGPVRGQPISIERLSLGHREAEGLPAVVLEGGDQSLLGQDFLRKFDSVSIEGDKMVLR